MKFVRSLFIPCLALLATACGGGSGTPAGSGPGQPGGDTGTGAAELAIRSIAQLEASEAPSIGDGVPQGAVVASIGQRVRISGEGFSENMRFFFGMNNSLAREDESLLTADVADLPDDVFIFTDPDTDVATILEVEAEFDYISETAIDVTIPAALACTPDFSPTGGPVLRVTDENGSSEPVTDVLFIVGPRAFAVDRARGPEAGGYSVVLYGENFSASTQIAIRFTDPATGDTRVLGDGKTSNGALNADDDLIEQRLDSRTIVIANWPTPGIAFGSDLEADVLVFENIDALAANDAQLGRACADLEPEGNVELNANGSRNFELLRAFTYLAAAQTGLPQITSIAPAEGAVVGNNVVVVRGSNFDGDTIDLTNAATPGIRIEIPAGSGQFFAASAASLLDSGTLLVTMPAAATNANAEAAFWLRNAFTIETYGNGNESYVSFPARYDYLPIAPVETPALLHVAGEATDAGGQRIVILGERFDATTEAANGVEIVIGSEVYPADRVLRHGDGALEVFAPRIRPSLSADTDATLRIRNAQGSSDFVDALTLRAIADAGATPSLTALQPAGGPVGGGNLVLIEGSDFDGDTTVRFGATTSPRVEFVTPNLLIATAPPAGAASTAQVVVIDEGVESSSLEYEYGAAAIGPQIATVDADAGHDAGGYAVVLRGTGFTPTTAIEFGGGSGNEASDVVFINATTLRVVVPAALGSQANQGVSLRATDALAGAGPDGASFKYETAVAPTLTEVVSSAGDSDLNRHGGDRILAAGTGFDATTAFRVTQDLVIANGSDVQLLGPGLALVTAPPAPGDAGSATLAAVAGTLESDEFEVAYVDVPAPLLTDVRTLDDSEASATDGEILVLFGDFFYDDGAKPLTVRLTGTELGDTESTTVALSGGQLQRLGDSILSLRVPAGVFAAGDLGIEVETASGKVSYESNGAPIFSIEGPQAPRVLSVEPEILLSAGGGFAVFTGRHLTSTTTLSVRTNRSGTLQRIRGLRVLSDSLATGYFPPLLGGMPPAGIPGIVRAEESDATRAAAIDGDPFTESTFEDALFRVIDESAPALLAVIPDHGTIDGGEQVLLFGDGFLGADGRANVESILFRHPDIGDVEYTAVPSTDAPLVALPGGVNNGKFMVVNDSTILLITAARSPILVGDELPVDVIVRGTPGNSLLMGAFTYENTPAVRTPVLAGITPNEVRRNGGSTHLLSGGFMTEVDRLVLTKAGTDLRVEIPRADFNEVNDFFVVFEMPDLRDTFAVLDKLTIRAEKDVAGNPTRLISNALTEALTVTFAGPPAIDVEEGLSPANGSGFGGTITSLRGSLFTTNTQVLFGTNRAAIVVVEDEETLRFVVPALPIDAPGDGLDLLNVHEANRDTSIDVAIFTQGGWAVIEDAYTYETEAPEITSISPIRAIEGSTTRITMRGERFLPNVTVVPLVDGEEGALAGSVSNVTFVSFNEIQFDYTAAMPAKGTLGPLEITFLVTTNHGSDVSPVFLVELSPFFDEITRVGGDDVTVPTTGIEGGVRVIFEIAGGNFAPGAELAVITRQGDRLVLSEVDTLSGAGQFEIVSPTEIRFTVPFAFGNDSPTLIEGNPNIGPVGIEFTNSNGLDTEQSGAFIYVPTVLDFDNYAFRIPTGVATDAVPHELTIGDINNDGLPDAAMMVRAGTPDVSKPEVYVFLADTFGAEDVNGDGITPDFAGTFTKYVINDTTLRTEAGFLGRGGTVVLGNFDDDDQLELAVPARVASNTNAVRVLIADFDEQNNKFTVQTVLTADGAKSDAVGGIAVGDFDGDADEDDIALIVEDIAKTKRRLTIFHSTGAFKFDQFSASLPTDCCGGRVGFLAAGNFDGKGADELIWAHTDWSTGLKAKDWPVVVATVNAGAETVSLKPLENFSGGEIHDIDIFDHDGDGKESAALIVQDAATFKGKLVPGGVAILLAPLSLEVDTYVETAFNANGRALGSGDVDGDGRVDLVAGNTLGEFFLLIGQPDGTFTDGSKSWFLPTIPESFDTRIENIGIADVNGDGLGEIWIGDIGSAPTSLQLFLNTSR